MQKCTHNRAMPSCWRAEKSAQIYDAVLWAATWLVLKSRQGVASCGLDWIIALLCPVHKSSMPNSSSSSCWLLLVSHLLTETQQPSTAYLNTQTCAFHTRKHLCINLRVSQRRIILHSWYLSKNEGLNRLSAKSIIISLHSFENICFPIYVLKREPLLHLFCEMLSSHSSDGGKQQTPTGETTDNNRKNLNCF